MDTKPLENFLGVISRGRYQQAGLDKQWDCEPVKILWLETVTESDLINDD